MEYLRIVWVFLSQQPEVITIVILAITAGIGFWGAKATAYANELKLRPLLIAHFKSEVDDKKVILTEARIENIGEGAAHTITIEPIFDKASECSLQFHLSHTNILPSKTERRLRWTAIVNGKDQGWQIPDSLAYALCPNNNGTKSVYKEMIGVHIEYLNATSRRYYTDLKTGPGGTYISKTGRA